MVDPAAAEFFRLQQEGEPSNNVCCDCDTAQPQWASVSHGIYISIGAAGIHRSLGVRVSSVRSLSMDSWKPVHLRMMELGGNQRFTDFLEEQGIPRGMPIREKYSTRAAEWYRVNLRALAEGKPPPPPLPHGTGRLPASGAPDPAHTLLDKVFADPCRGAAVGGLQRPPSAGDDKPGTGRRRCIAITAVPARDDGMNAPRTMRKAIRDSIVLELAELMSAVDADHTSKAAPFDWLSRQLHLAMAPPGVRVEERLKTMSTGTMPGFGAESITIRAAVVA